MSSSSSASNEATTTASTPPMSVTIVEPTAAASAIEHHHKTVLDNGGDRVEDDLLKFDDDDRAEEKEEEEHPKKGADETVKVKAPAAQQLQVIPLTSATHCSSSSSSASSLVEVPLHESSDDDDELHDMDDDGGMGRDLEDDEVDEAEHADHLSPLMMDNHTIVEHLECFQPNSPTNERKAPTATGPVMVVDSAGIVTIMKHSDTRDSLSSLDSDVCLSFDRRRQANSSSDESSSSHGNSSSSDNDHARDSGCETGPCVPARPYCPVEVDEGVVANAEEEDDDLPVDEERPFEVPSDEFCEKIVEQVEFYFSNESILKDAFLLKHVRRNKEGFVSLKLVSSFKRVRQLTKDWRVVGHAIQLKSKTVELNDVQTKVRRIEPLPSYDETMPSRTVVATDLPAEKITIEKAYEMFSKCGEIALVRILRVGGPIPADVRQFINKYPELLQKECALVEFVESRSARNALAYEGITVLEMVAPKKKTGKKAPPMTKMMENTPQPSLMMYNGGGGGGGSNGGGGLDQERSRGGAPLENPTTPRFQIRRAASGYYSKPDQVIYVPPPRKFGYNHGQGNSFSAFSGGANGQQGYQSNHHHQQQQPLHHYQHHVPPTAGQNQFQYQNSSPATTTTTTTLQPTNPHFHHHAPSHYHHHHHGPPSPSQSDTYEVYRRTSAGHIVAVTSSPTNKFNIANNMERRYAPEVPLAPEMRRGSYPQTDCGLRKMHAQQPITVAAPQPLYECQCNCQSVHQPQQQQHHRRMSSAGNDLMFRRLSATSQNAAVGPESPRKLSSGSFDRKVSLTETNWRNEADPLRKLSNASEEFVNGRRISTDSGYDRKYSFSSDCSNARSRSNSFICNHAPVVEQIIRAPTGPAGDGSRGFGNRTRKIGQILPAPM